jgi:glycosyltransferase involved in cell wall biosynthesis
MLKETKSCLLISYGPVPTSEFQTVEGGGMRIWGLARGLKLNGVDVTVAINASFPQTLNEYEGVHLTNWSLDDAFISLINSFDAVIVSYTMGDASVFVAKHIRNDVQLILDAYVPIYIEVSARDSADIATEYRNYMGDIGRYNYVLKRGDYFLCASESQKIMYSGTLSALGVINPRSYRQERILTVPFGNHNVPAEMKSNPYHELGLSKDDFVVLWFGGLYPWFRIEEMLEAMRQLSSHKNMKFVFVGGKNPFNTNTDFVRQYDKTRAFCDEHKLTNSSVYFVDWVDYDDRVRWFKGADTVISLNQPGEENIFSWRTRVMDFVWGELAIITNGGDPLSETLIANDAAIRLPELSAQAIVSTLEKTYSNQAHLAQIRKNIIALKPRYIWENVTKPIVSVLNAGDTPYLDELSFRQKLQLPESTQQNDAPAEATTSTGKIHKLKKAARLPAKFVHHARKKGIKRSVALAANMVNTQVKRRTVATGRQYVFIAHPMDNTGAPVVLMQVIEEFVQKFGPRAVRVIAPAYSDNHRAKLLQLGVTPEKAAHGLGFRFVRTQLALKPDDFVLMNTVAIYDNYREFILMWLRLGRLKHATWFIHEDKAQLPVIEPGFLEPATTGRIKDLLIKDKLQVLVPSEHTRKDYVEILGTTKNIATTPLHVAVDPSLRTERTADDFETIRFFISGTPADGRKGQMIAISALYYYLKNYYDKNPSNYRDFKLELVAIGKDYISQQISWIGESLLGDRMITHPSIPKDEAMLVTRNCNVVICCSLNETFGLYIAEGMLMGHIVLRNNSAGVDEQLKDGVNGYAIDHTNIKHVAEAIEKILNKKTNSNQALLNMSKASQSLIAKYGDYRYIDAIVR